MSNIINILFPFRYPIKFNTPIFSGMLISIYRWSFIKCPSIISTPLYSHNLLKIFPTLFLYWLYIIFRLYLGVNTICYLHIYLVWDRLLVLLAKHLPFFINSNLNNAIIMKDVFCCKLMFSHLLCWWFYVSHALRTQLTKVNNKKEETSYNINNR